MAQFIESVGALDPQFPPPYTFQGVHIHSFELAADPDNLQALCDTWLNIGDPVERGFVYLPLTNYVALEINTYDYMSCANLPYAEGFTTQQEAYVRLPVAKFPLIDGVPAPLPTQVSNFFPFIFVDNSWSAFTGREVVGLGKQLGQIDQTEAADGSYGGTLALPVLKILSPATQQTIEQVIAVNTGPAVLAAQAPGLGWPWTWIDQIEADLVREVIRLGLIGLGPLSTIQLKQFRDAQTPTQACYQALLSATFSISNVTLPSYYEVAEITFTDFATMAMAGQLGLTSGSPVQAALAYSFSCDMNYNNVRTVFIA